MESDKSISQIFLYWRGEIPIFRTTSCPGRQLLPGKTLRFTRFSPALKNSRPETRKPL